MDTLPIYPHDRRAKWNYYGYAGSKNVKTTAKRVFRKRNRIADTDNAAEDLHTMLSKNIMKPSLQNFRSLSAEEEECRPGSAATKLGRYFCQRFKECYRSIPIREAFVVHLN